MIEKELSCEELDESIKWIEFELDCLFELEAMARERKELLEE